MTSLGVLWSGDAGLSIPSDNKLLSLASSTTEKEMSGLVGLIRPWKQCISHLVISHLIHLLDNVKRSSFNWVPEQEGALQWV